DVISAQPLSAATTAALAERLRDITGKKVNLNFTTDESLLGGIVTRIGSTVYDGSVRNQLERLGEELAG
ncbi:MAG TPA: ATP synthase F1 subunit delta, partial [Pyrinomonadaceae bacterium]